MSRGARGASSLPQISTTRAYWLLEQADGPRVILFRGGSHSDAEMLDLIDRVLARSATLDLEHSIVVVDRQGIRRRPLPIGE